MLLRFLKKVLAPGLLGLLVGLSIVSVTQIALEASGDGTEIQPLPDTWTKEPKRESYTGEVQNDIYHGKGTLTYHHGDEYSGEFKDGLFHGYGTYTSSHGDTYSGEWKDGEKNGSGTKVYSPGYYASYVGQWKDDRWHGSGTLTYPDGFIVEGEWQHGIAFNPVTGEYNCDRRPEITLTGDLRIEIYEGNEPGSYEEDDGTIIPSCEWVSDERFVIYRGDTKVIEVDESNAITGYGMSLRFAAAYPQNPEEFPIEIKDDGELVWVAGDIPRLLPPGYDITGDGSPNLLIEGYTGGAHCCTFYYLLDIGENPRVIGKLHTEHSEISAAYQLPNTPGVTLLVHDWNYAYWNTCFACSPAPMVYLSFDQEKDWFVANTEMMKTDVPPQKTMNAWVEEIQRYWDHRPEILWSYMLELIYGGNLDTAVELMHRSWPSESTMEIPPADVSYIEHVFYELEPQPTAKNDFWQRLLDKISDSPFAEEVFLMNLEHLCATGPLLSLPYLERYLCSETNP